MCNLTGRAKGLDLRDIYGVTDAADVGVKWRGDGEDIYVTERAVRGGGRGRVKMRYL